MIANTVEELFSHIGGAVSVLDDQVSVVDEDMLRGRVDDLVYTAVFGQDVTRDTARWLLWELGQLLGIYPASIHELYMAAGRGDLPRRLTVPAINVRALNYVSSRAIFRAANKLDVGAMLFEIARSEMGYTDQRPAEYVAAIIGAAIKEGFRGPLFIQGDHFQVSLKGYTADAAKELNALRDLIVEAIGAGFYNIDIDSSTLVDLGPDTLDEQQRVNYMVCAALTHFVRQREPAGITISLGGEIGEVGGHNSTVPELHAFMQGYQREAAGVVGISKISVQTGTSHGGVVLPDGTLAQVKVDFETLGELSRVAREEYGLGGAVQHGASTLPESAFGKFPEVGAIEIHLATNFQNIIFNCLPEEEAEVAEQYVMDNFRAEWKEGKTEEQFIYSTRKKCIGPLKRRWWDFPEELQDKIGAELQSQYEFLFDKLAVGRTRTFAAKVTTRFEQHRSRPEEAAAETALETAADLAD